MDELINSYSLVWESPVCQRAVTKGFPFGSLLAEDGSFLFKEVGGILTKE